MLLKNYEFKYAPRVFDAKTVISLSNSTAMFIIGFILALPFNTFSNGKVWTVFQEAMSESHWAIIFLAVGVIGFFGSFPWANYYYRIFALSLVATTLGFIAILFTIGNPAGIGGVFGVWAIQGYYMVDRAYKWEN